MPAQWFLYPEKGEKIEAPYQRWRWEVEYLDGTGLKQFGDDGHYHQFPEIRQDALKRFGMFHDTLPTIIIPWRKEMKLIHFYRNFVLGCGADNERKYKFVCFGYETPTEKMIVVILPNDTQIITNDVDSLGSMEEENARPESH